MLTPDGTGSTVLLAVLAAFGVWCLFLRKRGGKDEIQLPPLSKESWLKTISTLSTGDAPWFLLDQSQKLNSDVYRLNIPILKHGCLFVIGDAALARTVLTHRSSEKIGPMAGTKSVVGGTVTLVRAYTKSSHWKLVRKAAAPAFSSRQVRRMNAICCQHVEQWVDEVLEPLVGKAGATFDPAVEMTRITTAVICEAAFEYKVTPQETTDFLKDIEIVLREYVQRQAVNLLRKYFRWLVPSVWEARASALRIRAFCRRMLETYRDKRQSMSLVDQDADEGQSVIRLIAENPHLTDFECVSELTNFLVGGYDTTGYTLSNALVQLAKKPAVAEKLRSELQHAEVVGGNKDSQYSAWSQCSYLHHVIRENHRLCPVSALGGSPRVLECDLVYTNKEQGEMVLPKGTALLTPYLLIHRNPKVFSDPQEFNPDRWANATSEMNQSIMVFSLGSRGCVAQPLATAEIQSALPRLMRNYKFEIEQEGEWDFFLTLKMAGCRLGVKRAG